MAVETPEPFPRKQLIAELGAALAVLYLPFLCAGIYAFLGDYPFYDVPVTEVIRSITIFGDLLLIIYFMQSRGEPLSKFGFASFKLSDFAWALGIVLFLWVVGLGSQIATRPLQNLPGAHQVFSHHSQMPLWMAPGFYLVAALFEEMLWRSYAFTRLVQMGLKPIYAVILCAALFASYHIYQGWAVLPPIFVIGLAFGFFFLKFRRLWPLVIGHALYNILIYLIYQGIGSP